MTTFVICPDSRGKVDITFQKQDMEIKEAGNRFGIPHPLVRRKEQLSQRVMED